MTKLQYACHFATITFPSRNMHSQEAFVHICFVDPSVYVWWFMQSLRHSSTSINHNIERGNIAHMCCLNQSHKTANDMLVICCRFLNNFQLLFRYQHQHISGISLLNNHIKALCELLDFQLLRVSLQSAHFLC